VAGVTAASPSVMAHLHTSAGHTIGVDHLRELLARTPIQASAAEYADAVVNENVLGRATLAGRKRVLRHLRELYVLDSSAAAFRALRDLWPLEADAQRLLAGLLAFSRDELLRASFTSLREVPGGVRVGAAELAAAVAMAFPDRFSDATLAKIGRNTAASWTQTGHLVGRTSKTRTSAGARSVSVAYALLLGHLDGARGSMLLGSQWISLLDLGSDELAALIDEASRQGLLNRRSAGGVLEITFPYLQRSETGAVA